MDFYTERIYYLPALDDGTEFLADGIWPRAISKNKEQTRVDSWKRLKWDWRKTGMNPS